MQINLNESFREFRLNFYESFASSARKLLIDTKSNDTSSHSQNKRRNFCQQAV